MAQYINKATLVAEIERRVNAYQKIFDKADNKIARISTDGRIESLKNLLDFINTLEVKEVDLEKEISEYFVEHPDEFFSDKYKLIAKHFYELGLKTRKEE